jgi:hypothetical protein
MLPELIAQAPLASYTGSIESLDIARNWLNNCEDYHDTCSEREDRSYRPSRLIYLGRFKSKGQLCLHIPVYYPEDFRYMTLSHCWGETQPLKLLKGNLPSFRKSIPFESLPQTFKDAITVASHLGARYIWIDSLCIIQDCRSDWKRESAMMGKIYRNSFCNIAATDACNGLEGCLNERNPRALQPDILKLYFSETRYQEYYVCEKGLYTQHPLYTRAWVLQEALLAPRTLECGRGQLSWRCCTKQASEVFPGGTPRYHVKHAWDLVGFRLDSIEEVFIERVENQSITLEPGRTATVYDKYQKPDSPFAHWVTVVEKYSNMKLTQAGDRVVALTGIVELFRPLLGRYLAGLWYVFLPQELLWTPVEKRRRRALPLSETPTWSWMSINDAVSFKLCQFKLGRDTMLAEMMGVENETTDFSKFKGMGLLLHAVVFRVTYREVWFEIFGRSRSHLINSVNGYAFEASIADPFGYVIFDFDTRTETPPKDIYCMPILADYQPSLEERVGFSGNLLQSIREKYPLLDKPAREKVYGLALVRRSDNKYERVGHFWDEHGISLEVVRSLPKQDITLV